MRNLVLLVVLSCAGCFAVPDHASCDGRPQSQDCTDLLNNKNNHAGATLKALCAGTFSENLCDHTGALGGCQCDGCENGKAITWLFPDPPNHITTAADVMTKCANQPYVAP